MAKKKIKTTKADFKYFKECCEYWMTELGIKDWHIDYDHCDLPDSFAEVTYTYSRRAATLCLSKDWTGRKVTRVSLDETIAARALWRQILGVDDDFFRFEAGVAVETSQQPVVAVNFEQVLRSGLMVQIVDILGDDAFATA